MKFLGSFFLSLLLLFSYPANAATPQVETYEQLLQALRAATHAAELRIQQDINHEKIREAWEKGRLIREHILLNRNRSEIYGKQIIERLAHDLGISISPIYFWIAFSKEYPEPPKPKRLTLTHYYDLLRVNDLEQRKKFEDKVENGEWGSEELRRAITQLKNAQKAVELKLPEIKPGKVGVYRIVRASEGPFRGELVLDLGFSNYFKLGDIHEFQEGDLILAEPSKRSSKKTALSVHFKKIPQHETPDSLLYTYKAYVRQVVDGDTLKVVVDLGFGIYTEQKLRFKGIDAPELMTDEGKQAKIFVEKQLQGQRPILIKAVKSDKYDRYLADIWVAENYLNQKLLDEGLAFIMND